ncbi:hypothetical protein IWW39_001432 [Coemansia spiralis]|uniref:Prokaryotic-type class I peptide chain release factors domain-containing protein n=1 Tax=Coemansia spiralis TaxID=417178 RepID=A0A9W8GPY0_9FUNG|nr:hypothetical protein IWW39_001432 [Coemansia spiralis]
MSFVIAAVSRALSPQLAFLRTAIPLALNRYTTDIPDIERPSSPTKRQPSQPPTPIILEEQDIEEKHIRGWGNGGQKLNKTSSCVQLLHRPTGTMVTCQDTRYLQQNRKIALKRLKDKLDLLTNGSSSKTGKKIAKLQARKHKQRQRARKKYHSGDPPSEQIEEAAI